MTPELITSSANPKFKRLAALQEKSRLRRSEGVFVVEGRRELEHCTAAGFEVEAIFICPEIYDAAGKGTPRQNCSIFHISRDLYSKVAYREGTEGIIAEVKAKQRDLKDLNPGENPLIMVLESVEKPGNLGAVLRSADAAGADAVIVCDPLTDLYNPNLIRASLGAIFTVPVVTCSSEDAIAWLKERGIRILTAQLQDSSVYYDMNMTGATAIVMGTESTGLTQVWRDAADSHILIPMLGRLDSLNVSVSAAVLLYEAVRQRRK